jgi:hypothetical protein
MGRQNCQAARLPQSRAPESRILAYGSFAFILHNRSIPAPKFRRTSLRDFGAGKYPLTLS